MTAALDIAIYQASYDGLYWGRYPQGNKPGAPTGAAVAGVSLSGALTTGVKLASAAALAALAAGTLTGGAASFNPNYPRLGAARLQASFGASALQYGTAYTTWAAYLCLQVLGLNYDGGAASGPGFPSSNRNQYVQTLKSTNKTSGKVLQYQESSTVPTAAQSWPGFDAYIAARNWYQYAAGTSGTVVLNGSFKIPNESTYVPLDASGHIEQEYRALYTHDNLVSGSGANHTFASALDAAPSIDGIYWDDTWYSPIQNCDPQRTGATQAMQNVFENNGTTVQNLAEQWRAGQKRKFAILDILMPGNFHYANCNAVSILLEFGGQTGVDAALANPQQWAGSFWQLLDGFEVQLFFGWGFFEGSTPFATMMKIYRLAMAICRGPKLVMLDIGGGSTVNNLTADGKAPLTWSGQNAVTFTAPYVGMRYYITFTLMGSGVLDCDGEINSTNLNLLVFDEWGNNTAQYPSGFEGQPVDPVQTAAKYGNGIWERRFFNPVTGQFFRAVMNPRGNGAQTYNPGVTLFKMRGVQNPSYNNAASFTTLVMADPDGGIFCESPQ